MAEIAIQNILIDGVVKQPLAQVTSDDTFDNDGKTFLEVENQSGGPLTVTIQGQVDFQHGVSATKSFVVGDGLTNVIGPFPERFYNTDGANEVAVNYSTISSVTAAAYSVRDIHA